MRRIPVTEGVEFVSSAAEASLVRRAADRLRKQLRPTMGFLTESGDRMTVRNVIGSIRLDDGSLLEVSPKVDADQDWVRATLDLLVGTDRLDIAGERLAGLAPRRRDLLDVLAATYAARLQRAVRRDGPMLVVQRHEETLPILKGKLRLTPWLHDVALRPHRFPTAFDLLESDNDFTRAMAHVASSLAGASNTPSVRSLLHQLALALRPGAPEDVRIDPSIIRRPFPPQWAVYRPAWSIAVAVISRSSLLASRGQHRGFEVAIEAWPLLETLLERSLVAAVRIAADTGTTLQLRGRGAQAALLTEGSTVHQRVEPDGWLLSGGHTLAVLEAKYAPAPRQAWPAGQNWPERGHVFQVLAAAAACSSPLAVLIYPGLFEPHEWEVKGFNGTPSTLIAMGLGLFSYRRGAGDDERGSRLLEVLDRG
jgi:5-methylcytosine-specific restriction endonuclease McrBC regulatory subunit McrC